MTLLELTIVMAIVMILSGGVFLSLRQTARRALENASLQVQADLRKVQRRAVMEGRTHGISFLSANTYRLYVYTPVRMYTSEIITLPPGVRFDFPPQRLTFTPRGTSGNNFTVRLRTSTDLLQRITVTVGGGRVHIYPVERTG